MVNRQDRSLNGMIVGFSGTSKDVADCDWLRNFFRKGDNHIFRSHDPFLQNNITICRITAKKHNCRFLTLERNIQIVAARFALQTLVTAFTILFPCMDRDTPFFATIAARTIYLAGPIPVRHQ